MPTHRIAGKHVSLRSVATALGIGAVIGIIIALTLGLAAYAAAASYESVSGLAVRLHVPLPRLNPVGIDGGLLGVIVLDIALTWIRKPIRWLRFTARLFAAGTVAANVMAGWPDPAGIGLRIAAPVLIIVIVEAGRHILLHRDDEPDADRIPRIRWLIDFRGTFALWRRMHLWGEKSYTRAVDIELERIAAMEKLSMRYGPDEWAAEAPADLVWMLRAGVRMTEALARVAELTAGPASGPAADVPLMSARNKRPAGTGKAGKRNKVTRNPAVPEPAAVPQDADDEAPIGLEGEALILWYIDQGCTPSAAGKKAGFAEGYGRRIGRKFWITTGA